METKNTKPADAEEGISISNAPNTGEKISVAKPNKVKAYALFFALFGAVMVAKFTLFTPVRFDPQSFNRDWRCRDNSNKISSFRFNDNNQWQWIQFMPQMNGNMTIFGNYVVNGDKITLGDTYTQLPGYLGLSGPGKSTKSLELKLKKLTNIQLDFDYTGKDTAREVDSTPISMKCDIFVG